MVDGSARVRLGRAGIGGRRVYTVAYKDVSAVVQRSPLRLYRSDDGEEVKGWVMAHQEVVEAVWKSFGTVIPAGFNTIIKGNDEKVREWLKEDYTTLREKLERVRGKAEFSVQVLLDPEVIGRRISEASYVIKRLKEEAEKGRKGVAYFYKQRLERVLREEMEKRADEYFREFYKRVKRHTNDIRVERTKKVEGRVMLMNLSVLASQDKVKPLGEELAKIGEVEGLDVRFTGPWPPYSFA